MLDARRRLGGELAKTSTTSPLFLILARAIFSFFDPGLLYEVELNVEGESGDVQTTDRLEQVRTHEHKFLLFTSTGTTEEDDGLIAFTIHTSPARGNPKYLSLTRNVVAPKSNRLFFVNSVSKNLSSASLRLFTAYDKKGGSRSSLSRSGPFALLNVGNYNLDAVLLCNMQLLSLTVLFTALVLTTAQWHGSCQTEKECGAECAKFCGSSTYIQQCADGNPGGCDCLCQSPCMREKGRSCQTVFLYYAKDRRH